MSPCRNILGVNTEQTDHSKNKKQEHKKLLNPQLGDQIYTVFH